jgi:sigma-54 dependent transcriptional regulator, acetoin dehydrogenase operon transcriptional activator AcoR
MQKQSVDTLGRGTIHAPLVGMQIQESWRRSRRFGLRKDEAPDFDPAGLCDLSLAREQSRELMAHAAPVMETLHDQIVDTESMIVLTDAGGLILHALGDDSFLQKADKVALKPGVAWSEARKGTNAIGTAIAENNPVLVHADQHYLRANSFLTCSASPIHAPTGELLGVLDVTGDYRGYHKHTMGLVRMSTTMIENALFRRLYHPQLLVAFHTRPEFIGTLMEGLIAFEADGRVLSANAAASFQAGMSVAAMRTHTAQSLLNVSLNELLNAARRGVCVPMNGALPTGVKVCLVASGEFLVRRSMGAFEAGHSSAPSNVSPLRERAQSAPIAPCGDTPPLANFDALCTGDPQIASIVARLKRVADADVCVLLEGETGSGKEWFARALHAASSRANKPFIAVNCASIPEGLIESELFGYEEGAFTGARRRGQVGKVLAANGGTLFLDEIGDMPLAMQARLLRMLQERAVNPLGCTRSVPVDIKVIGATHRKLRTLIAEQRFRDDLYYRLNGLTVRLPSLRERTDIDAVIARVLAADSHEPWQLAPQVQALFQRHSWPGNLRQLANVLRTARALAGVERVIEREHLPDDFFDDVQEFDGDLAAPQPMNPAIPAAQIGLPSAPAPVSLQEVERHAITRTLAQHQGNVSAACRVLGISRNTFYRRMKVAEAQ